MRFRPSSAAAAGAALALVLTGCSAGDDARTAAPLTPVAGDEATQQPSDTPTAQSPSPSTSAVPSASASSKPTRMAPRRTT